MDHQGSTRVLIAAALTASAGLACSALAWAEKGEGPETRAEAEPRPGDTARVRFNFSEAPFAQVLDFFSRQTGLPVIREAEVPPGAMSFISAADYSLNEALEILNLNLAMHGRMLVRQENFLFLRTLEDAARKPGPVFGDEDLDGVDPTQYLTISIPLSNANVTQVAEKIKPLVKAPGLVTAVETQNMLLVVETAAQCVRIREIVRQIDSVRPVDSEYRIFTLRHAKAGSVVEALRGLVGQRILKQIIEKDGSVRQVEEVDVAGLNIQADERLNAVIAVGSASRIETVEELVALLDAPEGGLEGGSRELSAFRLRTVTAQQASEQLDALFRSLPVNRKPTIIPLETAGKLVVVGERGLLLQATALLGELDPPPGGGDPLDAGTVARVIRLEHATASAVESIARRMLTPRQTQMLRFAPTPSGQGLLVSGSPGDVGAFESLVRGIDTRPEVKREVRLVTIPGTGSARAVLDRALELDRLADAGAEDPVGATLDEGSRTATLVGSVAGIQRLEQRLREAAGSVAVRTVQRTYTPSVLRPSELAQRLGRLARPMLIGADPAGFVEPSFEGIDELDTLVIRAEGEQFAVIDELIASLDVERASGRQLRVIPLSGHDPRGLLTRALSLASRRASSLETKDPAAEEVETEFDELSGNLIARGTPEALALLDECLREAQRLVPPERVTRILDLRHVTAESILEPLRELLASAEVIGGPRGAVEPTLRVMERTNSLLVTAESAQQRAIEDFVRRLDTVEQGELPPLRLLQVRTADVNAVSSMLTQQYDSRPLTDRTARPVQVRADAATGTLIVSAHPELFGEIKEFVEELNRQREDGPERATFIFPLKVARAVDVAQAMDKLYPQPPMPVDRRGVPMPWLQQAKEVTVSADPSSNSLIIDAPADRRDSLVALAETLDRVEVPPVAQLRTYRIERADLGAVASMLTGLARRGTLAGPAQSGKQKVEVVIEVEPRSNTLIVAGDEVTFEKVEQILEDLTAVPVERGLRIIPVANAEAGDVRERALAIYAAQIAQIPGAGPVDVTVDGSSNSLEVVADAEAMGRFLRIMDELQRQVGPAREVRLIELRLARAEDVIEFLRELVDASEALRADGGAKPVFEAIGSNNAIMAAAQPGQFPIIEQLIRSLDNQQTAERPPLRIIRLRTTDAGNVADILQRSFAQRRPEERQRKPVDIQADAATNSLVVSAHPDMLPEIEEIVASLNEAQSFDREGREIRIFPLKVARAEELARTIDAMYPEPPMPIDARGRPLPHLQGRKEVSVRADPVTNSLIVDAPAPRLSGFEQIVSALDKLKVDEGVELRTYRIERADLNAVSATLRTLGSSGALGATGTTPVTVSVEPTSRAVIVSGPVQIFERVEAVIAEVDGAVNRPATVLRMYPLKFAKAERLQGLLDRMLRARLRESAEASPRLAEELLEVAADNASNTLIISGPSAVQEVAEQLIAALDTEASAAGKSVVKVVPLMFAEAGDVARTLTGAIPSMELPSGGVVSVLPAAGSNALLLAGASADLEKIEALIEPLDRQPFDPEKPAVETFPLAHADAGEIARTVERLLIDQQQTDPRVLAMRLRYTRGMYAEPAAIRVEAERRTNALIVSGPAETIRLAKAIIERLDEPAQDLDRTVLTFTPARGDPAVLAQTVSRIARETMATERRPLEITAEAGTGSVLVIGTATQTGEAVRLLAEFDDRSASVPLVEMRSFALTHAEARAVAGTVQQMLADRSRWPEALTRGERAGLNIATPTVQADASANRVLVSVPGPLMGMATELIETLDQPRGDSAVEVRVFRLTRGDAASAANALRETLGKGVPAGEPAPVITAEPSSNTVVVAATSARLEAAGALIASMDELAIEPASVGVRTMFLRHARAESVAPIVERVLSDQDEFLEQNWWARWQLSLERARRGLGEEARPIRVAAERRLNAVVVSAPLPVLELAEQVVAGLDIDPDGGPGGGRVVRVISLSSADAGELSSSLESIFAEHAEGGVPPTVRVDRSSNSLIVSATSDQMSLIEGLARQLDQATLAGSRQMRSVRIDRARMEAGEVARTLRRLLEQQGGVRVEVIGVEELLREPERDGSRRGPAGGSWSPASPAGGMIREIERLMASVAIAAPAGPAGPGDPAPGEGEAKVTIAVDPATNTLVLIGSDRLTARLAELAKELEKQSPQEATAVRVVRLPDSADPRSVAGLITQSFQQIGRASDDNPGGFTGRVAVSPDLDGGAVIVWANDTDFRVISELIAGVARLERTAEVTIKVYPLTNIDARGALRAVQDLLSTSPTGRQARRLRELVLTIEGSEGEMLRGSLDPSRISMTSDPAGRSLIVSAPAGSIDLLDRFVGLLDQSPVTDRMEVRRYALENAEAGTLSGTIQALMDAKRQGAGSEMVPRARLVPDERTNSLLVTATRGQHEEIGSLIASSDVSMARADLETVIIPLSHARPTAVARIVEQVIVGRDPARRDAVQVSAQDDINLFVVKGEASVLEEIRGLVAGIDVAESASYPVRSIKLERADAGEVAAGLQRFFQQRARIAGSRGAGRSGDAAIYGDRRSGTVVVAASDDDFEQIKSLVDQFDAPSQGRTSTFRIIPLRHASVNDITQTVQNITAELQWERMWGRNPENAIDARVLVESNRRTNSIVVFGEGEIVDLIERVVGELDQPISDATKTTVRAVFLERGDPMAIKRLIERVTASPDWGWWRGRDPQQVQVEIDAQRRLALLIGDASRVEEAMGYIAEIEKTAGGEGQIVESIALRHAEASRAAASLTRFFREKARAEEAREDRVAVVGSRDGNLLIVSAPPEEMATLRDLVAQIDQPELGEDRRIEVYTLRNTEAGEVASTLRAMFPQTGRVEDRVIVTPQPSRGVLIVSAPDRELERVGALVGTLDSVPDESGQSIVTVPLTSARAADVATSLRAALPAGVKVTITPVERSNALLLTGSDEAIRLVMKRVEELDSAAVQPPVVFRRFDLEHAEAADAAFTLRAMVRNRPRAAGEPAPSIDPSLTGNVLSVTATPDEMGFIEEMIGQIDAPDARTRRTEFVTLEYARAEAVRTALGVFYGRFAPEARGPAERNVRIVADQTANSLLITGDESVFEDIRALLARLDTPAYDTSRQLVLIPLKHADAASVARSLNEGFRAPLEQQLQREQFRLERERRGLRDARGNELVEPTVLVSGEETPSVSAEPVTNTLIVFASRREIERIERIVTQLDVPEFQRLPRARLIPVTGSIRASRLAERVREVFLTSAGRERSSRVVVVGDDSAGVLIVRAEEASFEEIRELTGSLLEAGETATPSPRIIRLNSLPAARVRSLIANVFGPIAQQRGESLTVEIDRDTNALVIAASEDLHRQILALTEELDAPEDRPDGADEEALPSAGIGQSVGVFELENTSPQAMALLLGRLGLTGPQAEDRPGVVGEPIRVTPLTNRRAVAVLAGSADLDRVGALIRLLDASGVEPTLSLAVVPLKTGEAERVVALLEQLIRPASADGKTEPAAALAEQVRRLSLIEGVFDRKGVSLDLSTPIKLLGDGQSNAVIIASSEENVQAIEAIIPLLDRLPAGDAVVVRIFPLEHASASRVQRLLNELFSRGDAISRLPGTRREGLPTTTTGRALRGDIALTVDERTNALLVAGREEALALVEVLIADLDSPQGERGWIEGEIVRLRHADAVPLADKLREVLVRGVGTTPEAIGLREQIGRLRLVVEGRDATEVVASDLYASMSRLVIEAEENLNALIVIGTPTNIGVVRALVGQLDVEQASAANSVRVIPLQRASADRVAGVLREIFTERSRLESVREEDRLILSVDARTNALIVSTSPRSYAVLEKLIETLDRDEARFAVGLHVIPVPGADVADLAPKIRRLMVERLRVQQRRGGLEDPLDAFSIEAVPAEDLLIVAASDENLALIRELIDALKADRVGLGDAERFELIPIESPGGAVEMARAVDELYVRRENEKRGRRSVSVVPSERQNAILVSGTPEDIEAIRELVQRLDRPDAEAVMEVKRIQLRAANSLEIVRLVEGLLAGRPIAGGRGGVQATRLRFHQLREEVGVTEATIDAAIREQVRLTPDLRTNSVMVSAPPAIMALIEEVIRDLDAETSGDREIVRYRLENADAQQMALLLRDLFNLQQQGDRLVLVPRQSPEPEEGMPAESGTFTPVPDLRQALAITIDRRTNTLLVSGTREYLAQVKQVVEELDRIEANEREQLVYALKNAQASEIQTVLVDYFRGEAELRRSVLGPGLTGSLARQLEQEVTVVGDLKSNKVLVSASPRYIDTVRRIIEELDATPPQVMIQVLLAEVTLDDTTEWGLDFNVGLDVTTSRFGGEGYVVNSLAAGAGVATALGVPNLSVASTDFDLLIRALEVQGKLEVLSRPQVTVNNNEAALIQVGENVSIVTGSNQFTDRVSAVTERQDVGIIMNVTPSISPDGFVRMEISPEISQVSQRTTQIDENFESPIITQRRVQTTVTVRDGQTVVIGGLIQTQGEERVWKVPLLGDIPLIGNIFKSTKRNNVKTELLVMLRPVVIPGDGPRTDDLQGRIFDNAMDSLDDATRVREALEEGMRHLDGSPAPMPALPAAPPPDLFPERMERSPGRRNGGGR
jgi:type II secretion system protein D